jgi:uncharacterized membrane protein
MKQKLKNVIIRFFKNPKLWENVIGMIFLSEISLIIFIWTKVESNSLIVPIMLLLVLLQIFLIPTDKSKRDF